MEPHHEPVRDIRVIVIRHVDPVFAAERLVGALEHAGLLHDVGKVGVPTSIIQKPSRLDDSEMDAIRLIAPRKLVLRGGKIVARTEPERTTVVWDEREELVDFLKPAPKPAVV